MVFLARFSPLGFVRRIRARIVRANWEFWIGNAFVVFSTVLGVYLASHAALETALRFEGLKADRDNYYLRASLRDEFARNLVAVDGIVDRLERVGIRYSPKDPYFPPLRSFVWESLKTSPNALSTPPTILAGIQEFSDEVREELRRSESRRVSATYTAEQLREIRARYRAGTLAEMDANLAELRNGLEAGGMTVNPISPVPGVDTETTEAVSEAG